MSTSQADTGAGAAHVSAPRTIAKREFHFSAPAHSQWAGANSQKALDADKRTRAVAISRAKHKRFMACLPFRAYAAPTQALNEKGAIVPEESTLLRCAAQQGRPGLVLRPSLFSELRSGSEAAHRDAGAARRDTEADGPGRMEGPERKRRSPWRVERSGQAWHRGAEPPGVGSGAQGSADTFFPAQLADDGLVIHDAAVTVLCFRAIRRTDESLCL